MTRAHADAGRDLGTYKALAERWSALGSHPKEANAIFEQLRSIGRDLRQTAEGREGIVALIGDQNRNVRLIAASESLNWDDSRGLAALEELEQGDELTAVSAKYTLKQYRRGTLYREA
jgi:hypothetical protein